MNINRKFSSTIFTILLSLLCLNSSAQVQRNHQPTDAPIDIELQMALSMNWITASFTGTGASSGDAIMLEVKKIIKQPLRVSINPGTLLISQNSNMQNMIIQNVKGKMTGEMNYIVSDVINLSNEDKATYVLEAYCLDFEEENPDASTVFTIAGVDTTMQKILFKGLESKSTPQVIQSAIWMYKSNVLPDPLKEKFKVSEEEIKKAQKLLNSQK